MKNHSLLSTTALYHFIKILWPPEQTVFSNMKIPTPVDGSSHESTFVPFIIFVALPIPFPTLLFPLFCSAGVETGCNKGNKTV